MSVIKKHRQNTMASFIAWITFVMPPKDTEILEFNQYYKSDKTPSIYYSFMFDKIKKND